MGYKSRAEGFYRVPARTRIHALDAPQLRPMRELLLNPANAAARERLASIDTQIEELRKQL